MAVRREYDSPLREDQAAATRERILAALAELAVTENPALLSMQDVARRARVSVARFTSTRIGTPRASR